MDQLKNKMPEQLPENNPENVKYQVQLEFYQYHIDIENLICYALKSAYTFTIGLDKFMYGGGGGGGTL